MVSVRGLTTVLIILGIIPFVIISVQAEPIISIDNPSVIEGDTNSRPLIYTVSLSSASSDTVTVKYAVVLSLSSAQSPGDYVSPSGNTLTIPAGQTSGTVAITIRGDRFEEGNETIVLLFSNPKNATLPSTNERATGTIIDDDGIQVNDVSITEGDTGQKNAVFTISRNTDTTGTVTIDYATSAGTATANSDYVPIAGKLTFTFGTPSQTISVPIIGDQAIEPDETFFVNLSNPVNIRIVDGQGIGTILNDDLDADKDGITDSVDNCPTTPNPGQENFDVDEFGNVCDPTPFGTSDLSVTKTGPASVFSGGIIHYNISIQNQGPNPAVNTVIEDTIPTEIAGLRLAEASPECGGIVGGKIICNVPQIDSFFDVFIEIQTPPNTAGILTNTVVVTAYNDDTPNVPSDAVTQVLIPDTDGDGLTDDLDTNPLAFTAVNNGDWNDTNTWEGGIVPGDTDDKEILAGVTVTITTAVNNSGAIIDNFGTLINSGSLTNHFVGTGAQINNFGTFENYGTINNTSSFIINTGLFINYGDLVTSGNITIEAGGVFDNALGGILTNHALIDSHGHINNFGTLGNNGNINNRDALDNHCGAVLTNTLDINFNPVNEVLCPPMLVLPPDGSTVVEPQPELVWDINGETRAVTYFANLEDTSNPGVPIELVSLSLVSAEPLNGLSDGNYEWFVTVSVDPLYDPSYPFTSTATNSDKFTFNVLVADRFCDDMTINQLLASGHYNIIDNRDGHMGKNIKGTKGDDLILLSDAGNNVAARQGNDCVVGGEGNDKIIGGKGDDQIFGQGGNDKIHGQQGDDIINGGDGDDKIHGGQGNDTIKAGSGNDKIHGAQGRDTLLGEQGDDIIHGGQGNDYIDGGEGHNKCNGGQGNNEIHNCGVENKKVKEDKEEDDEEDEDDE